MSLMHMRTGEIDGSLRIGIMPPLSEEQRTALGKSRRFERLLADKDVFIDREPEDGYAYTEIDCEVLKKRVEKKRLVLNPEGLVARIRDVLVEEGSAVSLDLIPKKVAEGGLLFGGTRDVPAEIEQK